MPQILVFRTERAQTISIAVIMPANHSTMDRQQVEAAAAASVTKSAYSKQLHVCNSTPIHDSTSDGAEKTSSYLTSLATRRQMLTAKETPRVLQICKTSSGWLVAWHNGITSVFGRQTFHPALDLKLTGDHLCRYTVCDRSTNQANSAFHPFEVDK